MTVIITSRADGFRRCGTAHSSIPVEYSDEHFTADEIALLQAESMLIVEIVTDEAIKATSKSIRKTKE